MYNSDASMNVDADTDDYDDIVPQSPASEDLIISDHYLSHDESSIGKSQDSPLNDAWPQSPSNDGQSSDNSGSGESIPDLHMVRCSTFQYRVYVSLTSPSFSFHSAPCIGTCGIAVTSPCAVATWQIS